MDMRPFCRELSSSLSTGTPGQKIEVLARRLAEFFKVEVHEVGLFQIDSTGRFLNFVWPQHRLAHDIKIPIKSFYTALVSKTARERTGSIDNAFATSRHLKMFELSLADREHCIPMQKVMTVPVFDGDKLLWVIQISRKGKALADAGPDFTEQQLDALQDVAATLAIITI
ncbi:MAG: hypothetical protein C0614_06700 [Desulfuromonas sp.]|nr:MAG: hypothetical protein C0614_06700 [Desulfuromonas sp.]